MDTAQIRIQLEQRRDELRALSADSAQSRAAVELDQQSVGRLSRMDALQQQAMAQAAEGRRRSDLRRVLAALRRLEEGEFGYCEQCGEPLAEGRLALDPATELCVPCAEAREQP